MGKYIFLTGHYLPKPGATGMCIHQLAKEAARRGHDVTTVCYWNEDRNESIDGVNVVKIRTPAYMQETMTENPWKRRLNHFCSICSKLLHIRQYPLRSKSLVKRYYNAVKSLELDGEMITVVASVNPLEAVVAADQIKREYPKKIKTVYYCADTLSNEIGEGGILSAEYRTRCGIKWEKKLFPLFDKVLIMECHKEHYYSSIFAGLTNKMELVNFPLFTKMQIEKSERQRNTIEFVYAGTLYRELRNPQFICDVLAALSKEVRISVKFLGSGDCDDILASAALTTNGAVQNLGLQPHNVAIRHLGEADVLLSLGNAKSPMAPSKIYEYMSTGKPIIHTYTYEKDPCLAPLKKYGNALLLREGEEDALHKISEFILNRKTISFEDVKEAFILSTPEYSMDILEKNLPR